MRSPRFIGLGLGIILVPLLGSLGCTISITPAWHMPAAMPAQSAPAIPMNPPIPGPGMPNGPLPPGVPPGAMSPNGALPPITARSASDYVSQLAERLQSAEDSRQALANRLQNLELIVREKDQSVLQTGYELQESTKQMRRTREELNRLKQELNDSRAKNHAKYQEYKSTLDLLMKTLESNLEIGKTSLNFRPNPTSLIGEPPTP